MKRLFAVLASALFAVSPPVSAASKQADVIIRHVTLVDVEAAKVLAEQAVVLRGEDIVAVGPDNRIARDWRAKRRVEGKGKFLIPGLWDMHVHFGGGPDLIDENKALLPLYVANGITTIRDASGDLPDQVLGWRGEIAGGRLFGPRLLTSGAKIEGIKPLWKGTIEVGSEADVDAALIRLKDRDKVDFVKITDSTLKPELFLYALGKAKALGLRTSGHIPMALTVQQAVDAGISSIEHLDYAYNAGAKDEAAIAADFAAGRIDRAEANRRLDAGFDRATAMAAYRRFAAQGVFVTPTLNGSRIIAYLDRDDHSKDAGLAYIGPKLRKTYDWRVERAAKADAAAIAARHKQIEDVGDDPADAGRGRGADHCGDRRGVSQQLQLSGLWPARRARAVRRKGADPGAGAGIGDARGAGLVRLAGSLWRDQAGHGGRSGAADAQSAGRYCGDARDRYGDHAGDGA